MKNGIATAKSSILNLTADQITNSNGTPKFYPTSKIGVQQRNQHAYALESKRNRGSFNKTSV